MDDRECSRLAGGVTMGKALGARMGWGSDNAFSNPSAGVQEVTGKEAKVWLFCSASIERGAMGGLAVAKSDAVL